MTLLGPWVRRFLLEHLVAERNLARNKQSSYRRALTLLIPFVAGKLHRPVDRLTVVDVSADLVRLFLADLEQVRQCATTTRNKRLGTVHALAGFVGEHSPEHIAWCGRIRSIPFKKASKAVIPYLDKPQMDALLGIPDRQPLKAVATTRCCCFFTTPELAPRWCRQFAPVPQRLLPLSLLACAHRHNPILRPNHFQGYMFFDFRHRLLGWPAVWLLPRRAAIPRPS